MASAFNPEQEWMLEAFKVLVERGDAGTLHKVLAIVAEMPIVNERRCQSGCCASAA